MQQDSALEVGGRFAMAFAGGDAATIGTLLADDAVLHSPITDRLHFQGRDALVHVLGAAMAALDDRRYDTPLATSGQVALRFSARVRSRPIDAITVLDVAPDGLIRQIKVFIRPLPGLAAFAAAIVPRVARPGGRAPATAAGLLLRPLAPVIRGGERLALPAVARGVRAVEAQKP